MMEHVLDWLDVYHDGELHGRQLRRVEAHLAQCETCREELAAREALSALLQESPPAEGLMRPEQFVSQVGLMLPRRPERTPLRRALETGWRLIPVGLFGAWAFVQTLLIVVTGVMLVQNIPASANLLSSAVVSAHITSWLAGLQCVAGAGAHGLLEVVFCAARAIELLEWPVLLSTLLLSVIGVLYASWLASWWIRGQRRPAHI